MWVWGWLGNIENSAHEDDGSTLFVMLLTADGATHLPACLPILVPSSPYPMVQLLSPSP